MPNEMKEAAAAMGAKLLCEKDIKELLQTIPKIDNDRAILRALHFYKENQRVDKAYEAALTDDTKALLEAITESGRSSWEWLQNCYTTQDVKDQKISLALALTQLFLERTGKGVCRIHGGGFAGVIALSLIHICTGFARSAAPGFCTVKKRGCFFVHRAGGQSIRKFLRQ